MKWIHLLSLVGLTMALTACPARGDLPTLDLHARGAIDGRLDGWTRGAATMEAVIYSPKVDREPLVFGGALKADGTFSVPLPTEPTLAPYLRTPFSPLRPCAANLRVSDPGVRMADVSRSGGLDIKQGANVIGQALLGSFHITTTAQGVSTGRALVYIPLFSDRAVTITGEDSCGPVESHVNKNHLRLTRGWNWIQLEEIIVGRYEPTTRSWTDATVTATYSSPVNVTASWLYEHTDGTVLGRSSAAASRRASVFAVGRP